VSFFRIPSPSGGAERAKKGRTDVNFQNYPFILKNNVWIKIFEDHTVEISFDSDVVFSSPKRLFADFTVLKKCCSYFSKVHSRLYKISISLSLAPPPGPNLAPPRKSLFLSLTRPRPYTSDE
jgi:hypothetical protein